MQLCIWSIYTYVQDIKVLDLNFNDLVSKEGKERIRQRRSKVEEWIDQLNGEEEVLLRGARDVSNASEVKELLLDLLRNDPDIRNELVVSA